MRASVIDALRSLADVELQRRWGGWNTGQRDYDDLTLNVHILYDDCQVLPDPQPRVGFILYPNEVQPMLQLSSVLSPMIARLGESPDATYLTDTAWPDVISAARRAMTFLSRNDQKSSPPL